MGLYIDDNGIPIYHRLFPGNNIDVCVLATNGSCCHGFLQKERELNPDMGFLEEVGELYKKMKNMNNGDPDSLEALGGGFNVTLEVLRDKAKRAKIASKIREFADVTDEIVRVLNEHK